MKTNNASTGRFSKQIVDIYPRGDGDLPSDEHFYAFFSKFGPILELYRYNSTSSKTHVYIAFKTEAAVQSVKGYLHSSGGGCYWKKSCGLGTGMVSCPAEFMERIEANPSASSRDIDAEAGQADKRLPKSKGVPINVGVSRQAGAVSDTQAPGKRSRDEPPHQDKNKKTRFIGETSTGPQSMPGQRHEPSQEFLSQDTWGQFVPSHDDTVQRLPKRSSVQTRSQTSALELAQQAAELASSKPKYTQRAGEGSDSRTELDKLRAERDEAIAERDAAIKSCRALERELEQLKEAFEEKKDKAEKVLRLVTASLQSLQGRPEEVNRRKGW
ncbi:hypothetical protein FRC08_016540 [Ceratobasidium sp. 394]|nr:hypothetical protein FRC08_016540 [Ceratobasidium sp. 394]KAG9094973.1 hypothetical protein FS749_011388 [Ceratobasidium sp. UAMH 11750]